MQQAGSWRSPGENREDFSAVLNILAAACKQRDR